MRTSSAEGQPRNTLFFNRGFHLNRGAVRVTVMATQRWDPQGGSVDLVGIVSLVISAATRNLRATLRFESAGALEIVRDLQDSRFVEMRAQDLHPDR
jgi:hypothetical protein